ncbi:MAG: FAD-dependent oxidoreductase [Acholeplasmataceae bacterium]|jgi:thioredoxin reductase|nr:FAD-dependent oxidoreductase [Acholeplasmataceae bacterium]
MIKTDLVIIGGGAAGLSAALAASDANLNILIIERELILGGILNQCIHNGFGLHMFKEELTGPEYAMRYIDELQHKNIEVLLGTTVIDITKPDDFMLTVTSEKDGYQHITSRSVIIASGCYERTRGAIQIPGERPKGIMPAGSAQRYLNMDGYLVGKNIFILGSGDIGLIMARRMTLEGAKVLGVAEIMPYSNGLTRNIVQCLDDFDIPLFLSHTITDIKGKDVLEKITIQKVNERFEPIEGTEREFEVDTLLLSIGLIPDVTLFDSLKMEKSDITKSAIVNQHLMSSVDGLFICGNALHVHDLVDWVSEEGEKAGKYAKAYILSDEKQSREHLKVNPGAKIRYVVPQLIDYSHLNEPVTLSFRTTEKMIAGTFKVYQNNQVIMTKKAKYIAPAEMENIILQPDDFISFDPITVILEEAL